jgi:hypothetical protein
MSDSVPLDECTIALGNVPATDAFSLSLLLDGEELIETAMAAGPGIFRIWRKAAGDSGGLFKRGHIVGYLQRGVLLMPVLMPCDGWPLDSVADGTRVEHGSAVVRFLRATGAIIP